MRYETLISMFDKYINKPHDHTGSFWYTVDYGMHYSSQNEINQNPDDWVGGGYSSEFAKEITDKKGYRLVTLDDGCGGEFQAFFKLSMEIDPEDFD